MTARYSATSGVPLHAGHRRAAVIVSDDDQAVRAVLSVQPTPAPRDPRADPRVVHNARRTSVRLGRFRAPARPPDRRRDVSHFIARVRRCVLTASGILAAPRIADAVSQGSSDPIARTRFGRVRGAQEDGVIVFKGIPFAGSPTGASRFNSLRRSGRGRASGMRSCRPTGNSAARPELAQGVEAGDLERGLPVPERLDAGCRRPPQPPRDVLLARRRLRDWQRRRRRPPQDTSHDGAALARDYDVVVVTHNHRLGLFGYLHLGDILGEEYAGRGWQACSTSPRR